MASQPGISAEGMVARARKAVDSTEQLERRVAIRHWASAAAQQRTAESVQSMTDAEHLGIAQGAFDPSHFLARATAGRERAEQALRRLDVTETEPRSS